MTSEKTTSEWRGIWARITARFPQLAKRIADSPGAVDIWMTNDSFSSTIGLLDDYFGPAVAQPLVAQQPTVDFLNTRLRTLHIGGGSAQVTRKPLRAIPWNSNSCAIDCILELVRRLEVPNMSEFEETTFTDLQRAFLLTLELLQDASDDQLMVHSKLPYLHAARRSNGFEKHQSVDLPIGPTFNATLLTGGVLSHLTNVLHTGDSCRCGHRTLQSSPTPFLDVTIPAPSIEVMMESFWESKNLICPLCKATKMTRKRRLERPVNAVVVDVAWEHPLVVEISNAISVPLWERPVTTTARFALTGGIVCRGHHFMAFWRAPGSAWCVYDGLKTPDERVYTVADLPGCPSVLIYIPEAEVEVPELTLTVSHPTPPHPMAGTGVGPVLALVELSIGGRATMEDFYIEISPELKFDDFVALVLSTESEQLRGCHFVKGIFLRAAGKRVRFVNGTGWNNGLAGALAEGADQLVMQVSFEVGPAAEGI